jgi:hypothetical protein
MTITIRKHIFLSTTYLGNQKMFIVPKKLLFCSVCGVVVERGGGKEGRQYGGLGLCVCTTVRGGKRERETLIMAAGWTAAAAAATAIGPARVGGITQTHTHKLAS